MMVDKKSLVVLILIVFRLSLFANWPTVQSEEFVETEESIMIRLKENELLLLSNINESDYNSKEAKLPDLDNLVGIGDYAIISEVKIYESPTTGQKRFSLNVCSHDLTVFRVLISKPKSFSIACDLIFYRIEELAISDPSLIALSKICHPKLEGREYSLIINSPPDIRLTRLSIERGIMIGVDHFPFLQPPGAQVNRDELSVQMNALVDELIALIDGDKKMTDEKEEYYKKLKAAYREVVPDTKEAVERDPDSSIWGED